MRSTAPETLRHPLDGCGASSGHLTGEGLALHYLHWRNPGRPRVVFLHGNASHAHYWCHLARPLHRYFEIVAPDLRGHGDSEWPDPPLYTQAAYVADLDALVERLGIGPASFVGHSMGGLIALEFAAAHPKMVDRLVLIDSEADPPPYMYEPLRLSGSRPTRVFPDVDAAEQQLYKRLTEVEPEVREHVIRHSLRTVADGVMFKFDQRALALLEERHLTHLLPELSCPVAIVRGADSDVFRPEAAREMTELVRDGKLVELRGGHLMFLENAAETQVLLEEFLMSDR